MRLSVIVLFGLVGILTGCATSPDKARLMGNIQLCEIVYFGGPRSAEVANTEIIQRGENCSNFKDIILERKRANTEAYEALGELGRQLQKMGTPKQAPSTSTTTNCRVYKNPYGDRIMCNTQ
jgi:hypothetical protein